VCRGDRRTLTRAGVHKAISTVVRTTNTAFIKHARANASAQLWRTTLEDSELLLPGLPEPDPGTPTAAN
jgi:hypothetical protein